MSESIQKAKESMEQGWKAREDLRFEEARRLLDGARQTFESEGDWTNATEALNHLAYTERMIGMHHGLEGVRLAEEAYQIAKRHNTNTEKSLILRALMTVNGSTGNFEKALQYAEEALPLFGEPASRADILAHIATYQLRTGKLETAESTITEAEELFNKNFEAVGEPHRSIWKCKILLTKALVLYNKGETGKAKEIGQEALNLAESNNLKTRIEEAKVFLSLFE